MKKITILYSFFLNLLVVFGQQTDLNTLLKNPAFQSLELETLPNGTLSYSGESLEIETSNSTGSTALKTTTNTSNEYLGSIKTSESVNLSGGFSYEVPIEVPLGINGLEPKISLSYNSQSTSGIAGAGWDLKGISSITRIPKTKYHNGENKPVSYDHTDALALDGQRLINSTPQGSINSVYVTENYSNLKIVKDPNLFNPDPITPTYIEGNFTVYYPNGSVGHYDLKTDLEWLLTSYEDINGNIMEYSYIENKGRYYISKISYGHQKEGIPLNQVEFNYLFKESPKYSFINGKSYINWYYLRKIITSYKDQNIYTYSLDYNETPMGAMRLAQINQINSHQESRAPLQFIYDNSGFTSKGMAKSNTYDGIYDQLGGYYKNIRQVSGDFDGDGQQDFLLYEKNLKDRLTFSTGYFNNGTYTNAYQHNTFSRSLKDTQWENFSGIFTRKFLNYENKYLSDYDGITLVDKKNENGKTQYTFGTFVLGSIGLYLQSEKTFTTEHSPGKVQYYPGDYNGDGIGDVLIVQNSILASDPTSGTKVYWANLDRRSDNTLYDLGHIITDPTISTTEFKILPGDYNGDGKQDLYLVQNDQLEIFSFNEPSKKLEKVLFLYEPLLDVNHPNLLGDYNGDGKSDLVFPSEPGSNQWELLYATGRNFMVKQPSSLIGPIFYKNIEDQYVHQYVNLDYNRDGKTDLMHLKIPYSDTTKASYSSLYYGYTAPYYPFIGSGRPAKDLAKTSFLTEQVNYNMGTGFSTEYPLLGMDQDPIRRSSFQIGFYSKGNSGNKITSYKFLRDAPTLTRLQSVIDRSNGKTLDIEYSLDNLDNQDTTPYESSYGQTYPYANVNAVQHLGLIKSLHESYNGKIYRSQDFKYKGAISNLEGLGYLGFSAVAKSGWYTTESNEKPLWTTSFYDPLKRGQLIKSIISLDFTRFNDPSSSSLISRKTYDYQYEVQNNKVVFSFPKIVISYDALKQTTITENYTYDTYGNATKVVTHYGSDLGTTTIETTYNNSNSSNGTYLKSRIELTKTTHAHYGDTFESSTAYTYNDKGLPISITKKGNNASEQLKETLLYDTFGNVTKRTLEASGEKPREESFTYDTSGRFLTSQTDTKGLTSTKEYDLKTGLLQKETSALGISTSYTYDHWMRPKTITDYLDNTLTYSYFKVQSDAIAQGDLKNGGFYIVEDAAQGRDKKTYYDVLGRKYKESTLSFASKWISLETHYDFLDRITKQSEPYTDKPSLYTINHYDRYQRLDKVIHPSGKITSNIYKGLEVTTEDGVKTHRVKTDALGNIVEKQDDGGTIHYTYYANSQPKTTTYASHTITIEQNGWGKKIKLSDSAAGEYTYAYNGFGEIIEEITPKGKTSYQYNDVGMLVLKTIEDPLLDQSYTTSYSYNPTTFLLEKEQSTTSNLNSVTYTYDDDFRVIKTVEENPEVSFTKEVSYDTYGTISQEKNKTLFKQGNLESTATVGYQYEASSGILEKILDDKGDTLYQINSLNEREQLATAAYSNGMEITNIWNDLGYLVSAREESQKDTALNLGYDFDRVTGNLKERNNYGFESPLQENFTYDVLDRLWQSKQNGTLTSKLTYDQTGRITQNEPLGSYKYKEDQSPFTLDRIVLNDAGKELFKERSFQQAQFTSFKKPLSISQENSGQVQFEYNGALSRSKAIFKNDEDQITKIKYYSRAAENEVVIPSSGRDLKIITYIGGPYGANISYISTFSSEGSLKKADYYVLHRDYLGSILAISDTQGNVLEKRHYGAWGELEKYESNNVQHTTQNPLLDRGWTGHEHLQNVSLIHMNGRLYDSDLKRMLSPDNYVQDPSNTQNFNRYQYGYNNPLKWTDPSGEFGVLAAFAVGALIGGASYAINVAIDGTAFNWGDFFKSAIIGGISSMVTFGIGEAGLGILAGSFAHGLASGAFSAIETGNFASGFLAGATTSLISAGVLKIPIGENKFVKYAVSSITGAITGGVGSVIGGGDFWRGARQGIITSTLNHTYHYFQSKIEYNRLQKSKTVNLNSDSKAIMARFGLTDPPTKSWWEKLGMYLIDSQTQKYVGLQMGGHFLLGLKDLSIEIATRISNGESIQGIHISREMPVLDYKNGKLGVYDLNNYSQSDLINIGVAGLLYDVSFMEIIGGQNNVLNFIGDEIFGYGTGEFVNEIKK